MGHTAQPGQTKNKKPRFSNTCTNQDECLWVSMKRSRALWGPPKDRAFECPLQKPVLEKPSTPLGELENSDLLCQWAQKSWHSKFWSLNRVFVHGQAWLSRFVGLQGQDNCKEQDKSEGGKPQCLVLWVPTFWDLRNPDFARTKLSYRGKRSRRLFKILTFPLHSPFLMLLSLIVESIISCFGRIFRASHHLRGYIELLTICNFMDLIWEVMNWVMNKGQTRAPQRTWREDLLKGEATMPSSRYCSNYCSSISPGIS